MSSFNADPKLQRSLIEYLGLAGTLFNSGLVDQSRFKTEQNEEKTSLVHTWFLPPKSRHAGGQETRIGCWFIDEKLFSDIEIQTFGSSPEFLKKTAILLPETLTESWQKITGILGQPDKTYTGYMTSGGRSFWASGDQECFGIKFDTLSATDKDLITKRSLDEQMLKNTVFVSERLIKHKEAMTENFGTVIKFKLWPESYFSYLVRDFKWNKIQPVSGDLLLPMSMLLSEAFWKLEPLQQQMQIDVGPDREIKSWFVESFAGLFAQIIDQAIFETGIHPEMHQQNLTAHLRNGQVIGLHYHDLQDCFLDPMTMFLNDSCEKDNINTIFFNQRRLLGFPGEIMTAYDPEKLYISTADWWRRWLRVFGQYDRILNILSGEEPFQSCNFEKKISEHLRGLFGARSLPNMNPDYDLYQMISWATYKHQQDCVLRFLQQNRGRVVETEKVNFFNERRVISQLRAPWSFAMLEAWSRRQKELQIFNYEDPLALSSQQKILIFCGDEEKFLYWIETQ